MVTSRYFSKGGAIPTSSAVKVDGVDVVGLPHLSVSDVQVEVEVEVML